MVRVVVADEREEREKKEGEKVVDCVGQNCPLLFLKEKLPHCN